MQITKRLKHYLIVFFLFSMITVSFVFIFQPMGYSESIETYQNRNFEVPSLKMSAQNITIITPENKTYTKAMSGYFPSTYGFENDEDGTIPDDWEYQLPSPQGDSYVEVISSLDGHNKVVDLNKGNTYGTHLHLWQNFTAQEHGAIEFWLRTTDVTEGSSFNIMNGSTHVCGVSIGVDGSESSFAVYANGGWQTIVHSAINNKWYHISFQFECGTGNHYGLDQNYFKIFIDGTEFGDYRFYTNVSSINKSYFLQNWNYDNFHTYIDAIGYSWDPHYNIGDNLNEGLLLSFENSPTLEWIGSSLDGAANRTILGNITFSMPNDGLHTIQLFGNDTMGTIYGSNTRYFTVDTSPFININTPENKTYSAPMNGYYPATYGFENDEDGTIPDEWEYQFPSPQGDSYIEVIPSLDGHNKVVDLNKGNTFGTHLHVWQNFTAQEHGAIEFWLRTTDVTEGSVFSIMKGSTHVCGVSIGVDGSESSFAVYNNGGWQSIAHNATNNEWYHVSLQFECGTGSNYGLNQYYFKIFIDSTEFGDYRFYTNVSNIDKSYFLQNWNFDNYHTYIDAIGYSWDLHYNIGDNLNEGLLLSFESSPDLQWKGFSLDNKPIQTILGNKTITMPSEGLHRIQVFGNDSKGILYQSNVRYFIAFKIPSKPSEPMIHGYSLWVLIGIISVTSLIVIRRRNKK